MKTQQKLENLLEKTLSQGGYELVKLVYLFGSRAKDLKEGQSDSSNIGPLSDYDFGVVISGADEEIASFYSSKRFMLQSKLSRKLNSKVDLVILNRSPIELQYNAITFGIRLFEREVKERVEYEAQALSRYGDYLPVLRSQRKELIHGGITNNETRVQRYRKAFRKTERVLKQARTSQG